jgi:hypothetical protein
MARLVVQAARQATPLGGLLVVSVVGAEDGVPRTGLSATEFAITELAHDPQVFWEPRSIDQLIEGPAGVYTIAVETDLQPPGTVSEPTVMAIAVRGAVDTGWADDQGQTVVSGPPQ